MRGMVLGFRLGFVIAVAVSTASRAGAQGSGAAPAGGGEADTWLTYKGDLQRSGVRNTHLALPLNLLWRHSTDAPPRRTTTSPLVVGPPGQRRVYFAAGRNVYAVDGETGEQLWRSVELSGVLVAPISFVSGGDTGDFILAITSQGHMSALRTSNGESIWEADARAPVQSAAPVLVNTGHGERIVVGIATGRLIAFTRAGALDPSWEVKLGRYGASPSAAPAVSPDGKRMYVTAQDQKLYVIDLTKPAVAFTIQLNGIPFSSPVVVGDQVVVATGRVIEGYSQSVGRPQWKVDMGGNIVGSPSGLVGSDGNGVVYCGANSGRFIAADTRRGKTLWRTELQTAVTGTPVVLPGLILVGTGTGTLVALNSSDGKVLWQYRLATEREVDAADAGGPAGGRGGDGGMDGGRGDGGGMDGGQGGGMAATGATAQRPTIAYGVSSPPSVVAGQVFLLADNAALYAFDTMPRDPEPPYAVQPTLSLHAQDGNLGSFLLDPDKPMLVPGKPPIYFSMGLEDDGSGVDGASLKASLDGQPLAEPNVMYQAARGVLTLVLLGQGAGTASVNLADGPHTVEVVVRDYSGNTLSYKGSFVVDNKLPPPSIVPPGSATEGQPDAGMGDQGNGGGYGGRRRRRGGGGGYGGGGGGYGGGADGGG